VRGVGVFLGLCVALAVARAVASALVLVFMIALVWAICRHPREVAAFLCYCATLNLISTYPLATLLIIGAAVISVSFVKDSD
jgi:hypothetical protein